MATLATLLILCSVYLNTAGIKFVDLSSRFLTITLSFWFIIYFYTEYIGMWSYSPFSLLIFSFFCITCSGLWTIKNNQLTSVAKKMQRPDYTKLLSVFEQIKTKPLVFILLALAGLWWAAALIEIILFSPLRASDTFSYHIPTVNSWIAYENTGIQPNIDYRIGYWPHAIHSLYGLLLLNFKSSQYLGFVNLFAGGLLWLFAVYFTLQRLKFTTLTALFCAALSSFNTVWLKQSGALSTDLVLAGLFVLSIGLSLQFLERRKISDAYTLSIALALMAATKFTGMIFSGLLIFWVFIATCSNLKTKKISSKDFFIASSICLFFVFGLGAFTYWRNLIQFGNPIYPVELALPGIILEGSPAKHLINWYYETNILESIIWTFFEPVKFILNREYALSPLYKYLILSIPALTIITFFYKLWQRNKKSGSTAHLLDNTMPLESTTACNINRFLVLLLIFFCIVLYRDSYINPLRLERYLYFGTFLFFVAFAWSIDALPNLIKNGIITLFIILAIAITPNVWEKNSQSILLGNNSQKILALKRKNTAKLQVILKNKPTLIIMKNNVQTPYAYIASPYRKTIINMTYGPNYTDPDLNLVDLEIYESIAQYTGTIDKYFLKSYNPKTGFENGASYIRATINRYCIVNIISAAGPLPKSVLSNDFSFVEKFNKDYLYTSDRGCNAS